MLKNMNKKNTSNKTKLLEIERKLTDRTKKVLQISKEVFEFLLYRIYFTGADGYQQFLVFSLTLNSLTFDHNNTNVTHWISKLEFCFRNQAI